ncbi:MAG: LysM peptidoglycan-binding domain-containing protein [Shinella sp.]|nr:LysM peptidoglycan-binding domain-containing protein [Shinella sp.]
MRNKTGLVALIVLVAATLLMVFFVLPNIDLDKKATSAGTETAPQAAPQTAAKSEPAAGAPQETANAPAAGETPAAPSANEAAEGEAGSSLSGDAQPGNERAAGDAAKSDPEDWVTPAFDVLRVEPNGSTVIAGRAQPNTKLSIMNGETVIADADVGPSGDFAAVLDKPLAAGDYELSLKTTGEGGAVKSSEEVATVSVPSKTGGELLAMVSKPGEASRLISVPKTARHDASTEAEEPADKAPATGDAAGTNAPAAQQDTAALDAKPEETGSDAAPGNGAAQPAQPAAGASDATGDQPQVRVSAVEIEGDRMFVAGSARPGALVRIYAGDTLVGQARADAAGRYVVDGKIDLPVGRHTIRADIMSDDGTKVAVRASVPFDRPEGDQVAVVAQEDEKPADTPATVPNAVGDGGLDKLRNEADKAVTLLKNLYANGSLPTVEQLAAARSATEIALESLAEFVPSPRAGVAANEMAAKASAAAAEALARLKALPQDVPSVGASVDAIEKSVQAAVEPGLQAGSGIGAAAASSETIDLFARRAGDLQQQLLSLVSPDATASAMEIRTARVAFEAALKEISALVPGTVSSADILASLDSLKAWAKGALDQLAQVPEAADRETYARALAAIKESPVASEAASADAGAPAGGEAAADDAGPVSSEDTAGPSAGEARPSTGAPAAGETAAAQTGDAPQTVEQAPLKESKSSVIIRRGDTLWQISRRIYGRGVRYTTIYLANEEQIKNPDIILPGQVFGVPDQTGQPDEEAEKLHRQHVRGG